MKKIALDSMIFIYHFEQTPAFFESASKILSAAKNGEYKLITSIISVVEVLSTPKYAQLPDVASGIRSFFQEAEFLEVIDLGDEIAFETARLRRENKTLRTPDAIQLATAIIHKADVFITNDMRLKNLRIVGLEVRFLEAAHST
jgi:predicted nucleic acid-binding protein